MSWHNEYESGCDPILSSFDDDNIVIECGDERFDISLIEDGLIILNHSMSDSYDRDYDGMDAVVVLKQSDVWTMIPTFFRNRIDYNHVPLSALA